MKKMFLNNNGFNEAFMKLAKDKTLMPWAKNRVIRMHQVILNEANILAEIHKGTMEANADKDENGEIIFVDLHGHKTPKVSPVGMQAVEASMKPLFEEEIEGIRPLSVKDIPLDNYEAMEISMLVSAGILNMPDEEEESEEEK